MARILLILLHAIQVRSYIRSLWDLDNDCTRLVVRYCNYSSYLCGFPITLWIIGCIFIFADWIFHRAFGLILYLESFIFRCADALLEHSSVWNSARSFGILISFFFQSSIYFYYYYNSFPLWFIAIQNKLKNCNCLQILFTGTVFT